MSPFPCNLSELRQHAEWGEDIAQDAFARHHYHGDGVPLDYAEAARWFRAAADQGDSTATLFLAHQDRTHTQPAPQKENTDAK